MTIVQTAVSVSVDGFMTGPDGVDVGLHDWLTTGDTPSRLNPALTMSKPSAAVLRRRRQLARSGDCRTPNV
jgi:hypothetical protein